jgi:NagD protein
MMDAVAARLGLAPQDCVMAGDRLYTDVGAAQRAGMASALVLTGETQPDQLQSLEDERQPDYVLSRIDDLLPLAEWERRGWGQDG